MARDTSASRAPSALLLLILSLFWRTLPSPIESRLFHMESRWNPGEIQMDHVEHVEFHSLHPLGTGNFIIQWTPPGLQKIFNNCLLINFKQVISI
jgi:hypothetical protein